MFSYCAIASGYDFIDQNLELVVPDSTNPFSQFLDRIRVSKITPGMLIPLLSFDDEPPGYSNLRSQKPAVYASIPDGKMGTTNMVLIHANQYYDYWELMPKCLTFDYAADKGYTLLVFSQLAISAQVYGSVIAQKIEKAGIKVPIAPSTTASNRSAGFHVSSKIRR
jgi:hypothetical protein